MGTALLAAATIGVLATATLVVTVLRLRSATSFVLGVFTVAWALVVAETMLLSLARAWTRGWVLATVYAGLAAALAAWHLAGRPRPPSLARAARSAGDALRDPVVALLAAANAVAGAYAVVVAVAIPPFDIDVVAYHLPRVVLWMQQQAVAAIPNAFGSNIEGNPPAAEIAQVIGVSARPNAAATATGSGTASLRRSTRNVPAAAAVSRAESRFTRNAGSPSGCSTTDAAQPSST